MIIYLKERDTFGINLKEQEKSLQFRGIKTNFCSEQWNLLIGNKKEKWNFSRDQGDMLSTSPPPPERPITVNVKLAKQLVMSALSQVTVSPVCQLIVSLYKMPEI